MRPNHEALMREIDRAWPRRCLAACEVDFVRDENGLPKPLIGGVWTGVTLVSLDWGHEEELWLTRPLTDIEKLAAKESRGKWYIPTGGELSDRMDRVIARIREPPALWVDP